MAGILGMTFLYGGIAALPYFSLGLGTLIKMFAPDDDDDDSMSPSLLTRTSRKRYMTKTMSITKVAAAMVKLATIMLSDGVSRE